LNKAIEAGKETPKEIQHKENSINFAAVPFLGHILATSIKELTAAGKKSTGKGKKNLLKAV
jgi:hypothetical protein